jgi:UDP-glucose:(heptosyl)LPS alpha-1,3-glucosyltransferase
MGFGGRARLALNPYHAYMKATERKMFQSARLRAVICVSKMVKQEIRDRFGVADDKLHVIYNGVDTGRFNLELASLYRSRVRAELRWPESDVVLLLVGSGFERKGVGVTIEALRELPSHVRLLVVGKDKRLEHYRAFAQRLGLGSRVEFTGGQKDVLPYYGAADIFVMPSVYEPFGNVVLEAFASGLPVVTSTKCGAGELIEDNREGSVVDALDVRGLAAALLALTDTARRQAAGKAARRKAEGCTWNSMAASFNDLYQKLLAPVAQSTSPQPAQR